MNAPGGKERWLKFSETLSAQAMDYISEGMRGDRPVLGLYALEIDSGDLVWQHRTYPDCGGREQKAPRCQFLYGFAAAPIVFDGAVVTGSLDRYLRIFDGDDGRLMFTFDTIRE